MALLSIMIMMSGLADKVLKIYNLNCSIWGILLCFGCYHVESYPEADNMQNITFSQLRTHAAELKEALKRGEVVELTNHKEIVATIVPAVKKKGEKERQQALEAFFELGEGMELEAELERIKSGRKGRADAV